MKLIVGLGNPGLQYRDTRHNVGFMVLDKLAGSLQVEFRPSSKFQAELAEYRWGNERILLVKPLTYMNLSGEAVFKLVNFYQLSIEDLIIIYDDFDLPLGQIRLRPAGSAGSHKGMQSIIRYLNDRNIKRLRLGVGAPAYGTKMDFVLGKFTSAERVIISVAIEQAVAALEYNFQTDFVKTMSKFNLKAME